MCVYSYFAIRLTVTSQEPEENEGSMLVRQALEPSIQLDILEKSVVDINVLVLEDDGCYLCAGIIAASLALCDAGIPMFDLVSCCSVAALSDDSSTNNSASLFLDPSEAEMGKSWCISTIAMMPLRGKVTFACSSGSMSPVNMAQGMQMAMHGCASMYERMKDVLKQRTNN